MPRQETPKKTVPKPSKPDDRIPITLTLDPRTHADLLAKAKGRILTPSRYLDYLHIEGRL